MPGVVAQGDGMPHQLVKPGAQNFNRFTGRSRRSIDANAAMFGRNPFAVQQRPGILKITPGQRLQRLPGGRIHRLAGNDSRSMQTRVMPGYRGPDMRQHRVELARLQFLNVLCRQPLAALKLQENRVQRHRRRAHQRRETKSWNFGSGGQR